MAAACRLSGVDQRFAQSSSSSTPTGVSPFHAAGPTTEFPSTHSPFGANHAIMSCLPDEQPLDLTGGGAARKRRGVASPCLAAPDADSPLDLSVKRSRTDDASTPLSPFSMLGMDQTVGGGTRGGLAMCGGGVVAHSQLRSVHVARSPVPLAQLHAAGQQVPPVDTSRLGVGVGAVPVIRRVSSTAVHGPGSVRGPRTYGGQPRASSRTISDGGRLSSTRHARDITVVVNGHRPAAVVGVGTKDASGNRTDLVRHSFVRTDYANDRRCGTSPGRQGYSGKAYDRAGVTVVGGRSSVAAASPTLSVCSAYVTPPPVRPNALYSGPVATAARRLDQRTKVLPTLAPFPETSGSLLSASHRVTLVDRLDPTETYSSTTFLPPNVVAPPSSLNDLDNRGLYFGNRQPSTMLNATESSGTLLRGGLAATVWNSPTADVADYDRIKSGERSSAFGGPSENNSGECQIVDDRKSSVDGASTTVAERNFAAVTQVVDFVDRQRGPLSGVCSTSGGSLLGHSANATRRIPVANVHPIMKDPTVTAPSTSLELPTAPDRRVSSVVDDTCLELSSATTSVSSGRPLEAHGAPAKDVTALLAQAGLSRGGRVSSHHMEYVKFLSQSVDDTTSVATATASGGGSVGHPRSVRAQSTVDRRRVSTRGGLTCLPAKARRQLLPYFHHEEPDADARYSSEAVPSKAAAVAGSSSKPAATSDAKNAVIVSISSSTAEHTSCTSSSASSASAGRKTTPIVYFDDDESTETSFAATLAPGSELTVKRWRQSVHGPSAARKQSGKPRKTSKKPRNVDEPERPLEAADGLPKRRRKRVTVEKNKRVNQEATGDDDDLTELEDTQPSTSAQVSLIYSSESCVTDRQTDRQPGIAKRRVVFDNIGRIDSGSLWSLLDVIQSTFHEDIREKNDFWHFRSH